MSENYMTNIEVRLRDLFDNVANGNESVDDAVRFLKDELLASFNNGREAARKPRKTARPKGARRPYKKSLAR
jgi:hypothetical protein